MSQTATYDVPTNAIDLTQRVRERIKDYDGLDASGKDLTLVKEVHRRFCRLYLFRLSSSPASHPDLVVKVPVGHADVAHQEKSRQSEFVDRPRLFGRVNPANKSPQEYAALRRIQDHFDARQDPRFGVVRVYDLFPEEQAMVMQWIDQPSLRDRLYRTHRFGNVQQARKLETAFHNAGAWLRSHHELPPLAHAEKRNQSYDDYVDAVERFVGYLMEHAALRSDVGRIHEQIVDLANAHLPTMILTGQVHGDFAPRNVFIDEDDRVSVFDTLGRFEAPVYEDIAKMLMTVKASGPQMFSRGLLYDPRRLHRYEQSFLEGYFFDQPIPFPIIRLFEAQLVLEHWAATVYRHKESRGIRRIAKGFRRSIWQAGFQDYLREILTSTATTESLQ